MTTSKTSRKRAKSQSVGRNKLRAVPAAAHLRQGRAQPELRGACSGPRWSWPKLGPRICWIFVCTAMYVAIFSPNAFAHPFHAALAEVELNRETNSLEVALRIDAVDLEQALRTETKKPVDLDKTEDAEPLIKRYVAKEFRIRAAGKKWQSHEWIGWELEGRNAWVYFEVPVSKGVTKVEVQFSVLLNHVPRQVNMLTLTINRQRRSVMFHANDSAKAILLTGSTSAEEPANGAP